MGSPKKSSSRAPQPYTLSVAPEARATERALARMQQVLESRHFSNVDDTNAFLQSPEFRQAMDAAKPTSPLQRAQEVAYDAWASRRPKRYERARRALEIDERCSDAWLILAEQEPTWAGRRRSFEKAVAAAERVGREEG